MKEITPQMIKELRERTGVGMAKCKEALHAANGDLEGAIDHLRKTGQAQAVKKEGRETNEGMIAAVSDEKSIALVEVNAETDFVVKNERFQKFANQLAQFALKSLPNTLEEFLSATIEKGMSVDALRASIIQALGENIQVKKVEVFPKKKDCSYFVYSHLGGKLVTVIEISGSTKMQDLAKDLAMHVAAESPEYLSKDEVPARVIEHEKEIARAQLQDKPANIIEKILIGKLEAYFQQSCLLSQNFVKDPSITVKALLEAKGKELGTTLTISQFLRWRIGN